MEHAAHSPTRHRTRRLNVAFLVTLIGIFSSNTSFGVPDGSSRPGAPAPSGRELPAWSAEIVSDQVKNATALCIDDVGRIYVAETYRWREGIEDNRNHTYWIMDDLACETVDDRSRVYAKWKDKFQQEDYFTRFSDRVVRLADRDGDGRPETPTEFASGFHADVDGPAIGLLSGDLGIYLTCVPRLWLLNDRDQNGYAEDKQSLQDGFGVKTSLSGHDLHGLTWGPDGKLYFSMGDRGFHCVTREGRVLKDTNAGAVFRCNPDGSQLEIFYHQLRNPQELAFNELGDLFTVDNNCDQGDSARVCYLLEQGNSGWHLGAQAQTTYASFIEDGGLAQRPHWLTEGVWKLRFDDQPAHILPPIAHLTNGPSGLTYHSGIGFDPRHRGHFLVCDYKGAPNLCFLYSFKVQQTGAGYEVHDEHLVRGGIANTDVEVGYDGRIYLSDFGGGWIRSDKGSIVALSDPHHVGDSEVEELRSRMARGFRDLATDELAASLAHADMRVRLKAQYELARRGEASIAVFNQIARQSSHPLARYHAVWGLGQLRAIDALLALIPQADDELLAQLARTLGNVGDPSTRNAVRALVSHSSPRVRTLATIASAKLGDREALPLVLQGVERNNNRDAFERHAGVFAMSQLASIDALGQLSTHASPAVRLAAVLALRRLRAEPIGRFLVDEDKQIVAEAIRAINDEPIDAAIPALADYAARLTMAHSDQFPATEALYRRLVNGLFRRGTPSDGLKLVEIAANDELPSAWRRIALRALENLDHPPTIDATMGLYRPLPAREASAIASVVDAPLRDLFQRSTGELAASAIRAMHHYGLRLDDASLIARVRDGRQPPAVRLVALEQLVAAQRFDQKVLLRSLLVDELPAIRSAAAAVYIGAYPDEAPAVVRDLISMEHDQDFRTAFQLLASSTTPDMEAIFLEQLDRLAQGSLYRTVQLDLYEAAITSSSSAVTHRVGQIEAQWQAEGRTPFDLTREGGDVARGRQIFQNQGVCLKCHIGDQGGGNAGPSLKQIGRLRRSDELLRSILDPSAIVVDGYGTQTAVLDDGTTVMGTPVAATAETITLRTATSGDQPIERSRIEELSPITSPMPKQAEYLTRRDVRDLLAYLQTLQGQADEEEAKSNVLHE